MKVYLFSYINMASLAGVGPLLKGISPGMDVGDKAHAALRVVYALFGRLEFGILFPFWFSFSGGFLFLCFLYAMVMCR